MFALEFPCSVCSFTIRGEYEEEDFEYPVFCPKCGRQNQLPAQNSETVVATAVVLELSSAPPKSTGGVSPRNRVAWRFRAPASSRPSVALRNCVAVDRQGRIIAALGSNLFALVPDVSGCDVAWKFTAADHIPGSPVVGTNGLAFVHSSDGLLHAIDGQGSPARVPAKVGPALGWATPLVDETNQVLVSASNGGLIRVDESGQTNARLFFRHPNRFDCTGALRGSTLYIGSEDQFLHAVNLEGEKGRDRWGQTEKVGLTGWYINSAVAMDGPRIIAVSRDDKLYSFEETGALAWKVPLNGRAIGSPVVTPHGMIVLGLTMKADNSDSLTGELVSFHSKTGQLAWRVPFDSPVESTPVVGEGSEIYFGDNGGKIHAVSGQGQRIWSESVGCAVRSAGAMVAEGQIVFGLDDGSLIALRCSSQSLGGPWPKLLATKENRCPTGN